MPLHNGHVLLIETAFQQCDRVTVCLLSQSGEPIAGETRLRWLTEIYDPKACAVIHHTAKLPRDDTGYGHWEEWLSSIRNVCTDDYDAVFSSEEYGQRLAADLGAQHVLVDEARTAVPVSGTAIRANPQENFKFLPAIVREYYDQ